MKKINTNISRILVGIIVLFSTLKSPLSAQQLSSINYTDLNELPSNNVYYSMQDSKGYMWFATDKGVVKFDGKTFNVFTVSDGLADNECFDIFEDSKGRIWFSSYNGEMCFFDDGIFYTKQNCLFLRKFHASNPAFKMIEDNNQQLYYLTISAIYTINKKNQISKLNIKNLYFSHLYKDSKGNVYALSFKKKLSYIVNLKTLEKHKLKLQNEGFLLNSKSFSFKNKIYFSTNKGVKTFINDQLKNIKLPEKNEKVQTIYKSEKELYIGTANGLLQSTNDGLNFKRLFKSASITSIFIDREKNLWITTLNEGIYFIINPKINLYNHHQFEIDKVISINKIDNQSIFIGLDKFKSAFVKNKMIKLFDFNKIGLSGSLKKIKKIKDNYFLCLSSSLIKLDKNLNFQNTFQIAVKDLCLYDSNDVIAVGGIEVLKFPFSNFNKLNLNEKGFVTLKSNGIFKLKEEKAFLFYGSFGVKKFINDQLFAFDENILLNKNIIDIEQTNEGILWFASSVNGLIAAYKNKIYHFTIKNQLQSNFVSSLTKGDKNEIWLGTNKGISKINYYIKNNKIKIKSSNFSIHNGLTDNDVNDILYHNDTVLVGTKKGLCFFKSEHLIKEKTIPKIIIEKFVSGNSIKKVDHKIIKIEAAENNISIFLKGISFASFGKFKYKYKVKGLSNFWKITENEQIELQNLSPGIYTIEIYGIDFFKNHSNKTCVSFEILPYFYQTWWFRIFSIFILFFLIYTIIQHRLNKIRKNHDLKEKLLVLENQKLKAESTEITLQRDIVELEQKALLLQMNPHFIFNSINTIQALYIKNKDVADDYLIKFSTLLRQILEFSKKKIIHLDQEVEFLRNYLEINQLRFDNKYHFEFKGLETINQTEIGIAPLVIQPFIENALIHGIQSLKVKGYIVVNFRIENEYLVCEITDNGVGRKKSKERNKTKVHESIGMEITKKRLDFHNKNISKSNLKIIDLEDVNGNAIGTKVIIRIFIEEFY